ncbi:hypothetical protein LguiA_012496 [Lonicera macranthoides]
MPNANENANSSTTSKSVEPEKSNDSGERVDFDSDNDDEEVEEEEVEYEEVEEEVEVEEIEEEEEEEVEEIEEEEEEADTVKNKEEKEAHAKLLALPPHGSEVYIGGIPQDSSEEDLKGFCKSVGEVVEVRIMKGKDSNENKGFAFVNFATIDLASKAIKKLNNSEFKGKRIKCSTSQAKHRLFIGNIPRSWGDEDLEKAVKDIGPGVTVVELVKDMKNSSNNRGFAFIDYYNHACAEYSRQKMMNPKFKLDNHAPTVSWADPKNADSSPASQVKSVYVKNLPKDITQDQLKKLFEHHGKITKVVLPPPKSGQENNRIAFVHFAERSSALKALKNTERYEIDGQLLECSLAKPQVEQKPGAGSSSQQPGLLSSYTPRVGYGLLGGTHGVLGAGYGAAGFAQPMIYGRGPSAGGMAMMPMLLPDGRIGYVLQQPGAQLRTPPSQQRGGGGRSGSSGSSGRSSRGRHGSDGGQGRRYRPY